ncbi:M48 family metalloprotease [uncultured Arcticibacterium sp.]|uniref:MORN repeat-containing protein n=1 Tax=uncultured Arcticibacterium sp. TaxID=2173042 RepID=UPI0030FA1F66
MSLPKLLSLLILFSASVNLANAQEEEKLDKSNFVCSYTAGVINEKSICSMLGFRTRPEAQKAVERIVSRSGLKQNFYVMECPNIDNCFAAARNGERLIVYDASFMRRVNNLTNTDWGAMSILAHEIGHHLQGHTLKQGGSDPNRELEADEFSGFVMYQMGASLKEAQSAIWKMTTDYDTGSHPPRRKRMTAIKRGYENAQGMYPRLSSEPEPEIEREVPKTEPVVRKPEIVKVTSKPRNVITVRTGCIEGNCSQGYGVAVNRKTLEKYAGNWKNGRRVGYGIEYYADNRKKYEGDFAGSNFHGYGTYYFKDGTKYVGKFKQGLMHDDKATFYYQNGDRLYIRYVNGKKEGKGRVIYYGGVQGTIFFENDIEK